MDTPIDPAFDFHDLQLLAAVMGLLLEGRIALLVSTPDLSQPLCVDLSKRFSTAQMRAERAFLVLTQLYNTYTDVCL